MIAWNKNNHGDTEKAQRARRKKQCEIFTIKALCPL